MISLIRACKKALVFVPSFALVCLAVSQKGQAQSSFSRQVLAHTQSSTAVFPVAGYLNDISDEGIYRWEPKKMPIKVYMQDSRQVPGYQSSFRSVLANSFDQWVQASQHKVSWVPVADPARADIVCRWTESAPELADGTEAGRTRTYTRFDTSTNSGTISRATMTLLTRLPERLLRADEIARAYLHEVGHAFGLAGHSPNHEDIMAAVVSRGQKASLSLADVATINTLYAGYRAESSHAVAQPN